MFDIPVDTIVEGEFRLRHSIFLERPTSNYGHTSSMHLSAWDARSHGTGWVRDGRLTYQVSREKEIDQVGDPSHTTPKALPVML